MSQLTHYLIAGNHIWARGESPAAAKAEYLKQGGKRTDFKHCQWWKCSAKTRIDEMGGITRPYVDPEAVELIGLFRPNNK